MFPQGLIDACIAPLWESDSPASFDREEMDASIQFPYSLERIPQSRSGIVTASVTNGEVEVGFLGVHPFRAIRAEETRGD